MNRLTGFYFLTNIIWILLQTTVQGRPTYLMVFPEKMRSGEPFAINVNILNSSQPVTVTAKLINSKNTTVITNSAVFQQGVQGDLKLDIPSTLQEGKYTLNVDGSGGLTFNNKTDINLDKKTLSIYIQTDKPIYKAGETVKFRILATKMDLKVVHEDMDIEIYDANGNKIKVWKKVRNTRGVYQNELVMSEAPVLGDWKIVIKIMGVEKEQTFTIAEYVLPKFEVTIDLEDFALTTDKYLTGKVKSKYTFGKPVTGNVELEVKPSYPVWRSKGPKSIRKQFKISGEADFAISLKDLETMYERQTAPFLISPPRSMSSGSLARQPPPPPPTRRFSPLNWQRVIVQANVTESLTGRTQNGSSDITFYRSKEILKFAEQDPNNFKPGMPVTLHLETQDRSGKPWNTVGLKPQVINVTITYYLPPNKNATTTTPSTIGKPEIPVAIPRPVNIAIDSVPKRPSIGMISPIWPPYVPDETKTETQLITVGSTGVEEIHLMNIPQETKRISIQARYNDDVSAYKSLNKVNSPSGSFINLKQTSPTNTAGVPSSFEIQSTYIVPEFSYKIVTKGKVVQSGQIPSQNTLTTTFSLPITSTMAPTARLVVYDTRPDGELVADSLKLDVEGMFQNEVSIDFDKTEALPGGDVSLNVKADTGSLVNVLAVDQSVLLMKSGNDITVEQVKSELNKYDDRVSTNWDGSYVYRYPLPFYPSGSANGAFETAGLKIFTDATVPGMYFGPIMYSTNRAMPQMEMADAAPPAASPGMGGAVTKDLKTVDRVRKNFPERWLWTQVTLNTTNQVSLRSVVPDTITSWVATAFAVHPTSGLGVAPMAGKVKTFKKFFVMLNTPYSVVRGEQVIIQANVFNYLNRDVEVYVSLDYSPDHQNIVFFWNSKEYLYSSRITRYIKVASGKAAAAYFPIIPTKLGYIDLKVTAQTALASDAISKKLLVEPEGLPQEYNVPLTIDLKSSPSFQKTVPITLPQDVVPDSKRVQLSVVGDLIGPSIANIDKLLAMPYGCGEQNMLKFAPNIYITKYLIATDHLTPEIKTKAERFMLKGYQRELTYQRKDGSFSAFGDRDPKGSMWLTAFVVKCFTAGANFIDIDEKVIERAMTWMLDHQEANGTFPEPGLVHHKAMQGGSAKGLSLTAYVVIAFLENEALPMEINKRVIKDGNIDRAIKILEGSVDSTTDPYQLAVISYALGLAKSSKASAAFAKLSALAMVQDGMKHWESTEPVTTNKYYSVPPPNAKNIEMTSYALLTVALKPGTSEGLEILKWLISQRNPEGGFSSTQDTVMALQAMSDFGARVYSKDIEVTINVQGTGGSPFAKQFKVGNAPGFIDPSILLTEDVPDDVTSLSISASGKGLCLVEVGVFFNIDTNNFAEPSFQLQTSVTEPKENSFTLNACTRWLLKDASNMAVLEIGIPTGFSADKESIAPLRTLKRIEDGDRKIVLYFDKITVEPTCVSVKMERVSLTARVKPVAVRVYDYYDKTDQVTVFYGIQGAASPSVCQICGQDCGCYNMGFQWFKK